MWKIKNLIGQRFGRLTVIEFAGTKNSKAYWKCRCDCGNICVVRSSHLKDGSTQSCGCLASEVTITRSTIHGMSYNKTYTTWQRMKQRCFYKKSIGYSGYGGRGITVCDEWRDNFQTFYDYVSKLEHFGEEGYSLDRINNDGNYEPDNVRWATAKEQARNKRTTVFVEYEGETISLQEAAERSRINYVAMKTRWGAGVRGEELFKPLREVLPKVEYNGEEMTLKDAAKLSGISYNTLFGRYKKGKRGAELFKLK